jgi:hypothetical protein
MIARLLTRTALIGAAAATMTGCAAYLPPEYSGYLYRDVSMPLSATENPTGEKVGTGTVTNILGLVVTGDASIQAAARAAGITKISSVSYKSTNTLGIVSTYTVYVYGN